MAKPGRKSTYTPAIADEICAQLAAGKLLSQVCKQSGMPSVSAVFSWLDKHPDFAESYARAKELQADVIAADALEIADNCREGRKVETKEVGRVCSRCKLAVVWQGSGWFHGARGANLTPLCEGAEAEKVIEEKIVTADMVERARLQVDTRKWLLSKLAPKRYGDRLELAGDKDAPLLPPTITVELVRPGGKTE